jgi:hypothetical protein
VIDREASTGEVRCIPLRARNGNVRAYALVDPADYACLAEHRWHMTANGYAARRVGRQIVLMQRAILGAGEGEQVVYRSEDKLDNRRGNLGCKRTLDVLRGDDVAELDPVERRRAYGRAYYELKRDEVKARNGAYRSEKRRLAREAREANAQILADLEMKVCSGCKRTLPTSAFPRNSHCPDGLNRYCRSCATAKHRDWVAKNGRDRSQEKRFQGAIETRRLVAEAKDSPCADCGGSWPAPVMHFHHRDPSEKSAGVAVLMRRGVATATVLAEIAKCDLLCANCHGLRHLRETS